MKTLTSSFEFITKLNNNNNRDWFNANKEEYIVAHDQVIQFADELLAFMNQHDNIETPSGKKSLYRIYRDVRFSKDKTPYNTHWSGGFRRGTAELRGGYYFKLKPGESILAGGFWGPNPADLKRIREEINANDQEMRDIIATPDFKKFFGELKGEQVKTAPKGYDKDHPAIDLLRYKQFIFTRSFSDKEVLSSEFAHQVNDTFKQLRPFFDYMSAVLTTDVNGVSLID